MKLYIGYCLQLRNGVGLRLEGRKQSTAPTLEEARKVVEFMNKSYGYESHWVEDEEGNRL